MMSFEKERNAIRESGPERVGCVEKESKALGGEYRNKCGVAATL